jgi:hypothetical protein
MEPDFVGSNGNDHVTGTVDQMDWNYQVQTWLNANVMDLDGFGPEEEDQADQASATVYEFGMYNHRMPHNEQELRHWMDQLI